MSSTSPPTDGGPKKTSGGQNRRAPVACVCCRSRRTKCIMRNGATPCDWCEKHSLDCVIADDDRKRQTSKAYISSLQSRIQLLEGLLKEANGTPPPPLDLDSEVGQVTSRSRSGRDSSIKEKSKRRPKVVLSEVICESSSDDSMKTKRRSTGPKGTGPTPRSEETTSPSINNNDEALRVPLLKPSSTKDQGNFQDFTFHYQKYRHELTSIMANILKLENEQPFPISLSAFLFMSTFDQKLDRWYGNLPDVLRWRENTGSPVEIFSLHQQYHAALILFHRHFAFPDHPEPDTIDREAGLETACRMSKKVCFDSAIRISRIIEGQENAPNPNKTASTTVLQYGGVAATALIADISSSLNMHPRLRSEYLRHLNHLIQALRTVSKPADKRVESLAAQYMTLASSSSASIPHEDLIWDYPHEPELQEYLDSTIIAQVPMPQVPILEATICQASIPTESWSMHPDIGNDVLESGVVGEPLPLWTEIAGGNDFGTLLTWDASTQATLFDDNHFMTLNDRHGVPYTFQ